MFENVGKVGTLQKPISIRVCCLFFYNVLFVLNVLIIIIGWGENAYTMRRGSLSFEILSCRSKSRNN
jgi:hypothetical protein